MRHTAVWYGRGNKAREHGGSIKTLTYILFFGYVGLLIVAGVWGVVGATWDHRVLLELDVHSLEPRTAANILSQYRFLRALEFGFGLFAVRFWRKIFNERTFNTLFLVTMALGVVARLVSLGLDGTPGWLFFVFLGWEFVGVIAIYFYTRPRVATGTLQERFQ